MAEVSSATEFQFVNSTIETPTVPQDLAIRALIRKQAMKKASAARRKDGNYGKHNLRQYPVFLFNEQNTPNAGVQIGTLKEQVVILREPNVVIKKERTTHHKRDEVEAQRWATTGSIPRNLSAKGYELTSMKSDFDIIALSTLSTLHINRAARAALSKNPYNLIRQLQSYKQSSYLSYLPSMYGQSECLSTATDCVIARARQIISPHRKWEGAVITFYLKALSSLQKALDCPKQRYTPEVLCATEILALYELLDPAGETAWIRHAAGAARLVQLRGPQNYSTDFEKGLLMAHTGPIMTECLFNNEHCFLEKPAWKAVMRSAIMDDVLIADRSEIVVELMILKSNIPGFFVDVTKVMLSSSLSEQYISSLIRRIRSLLSDLQTWYTSYTSLLSHAPPILPPSAEYDRRCKVFATYLSCAIISSRLLGALSAIDRVALERSTLTLAGQMLDMDLEVQNESEAAALFMAQTVGVSQATIKSSASWLEGEHVTKVESPDEWLSASPDGSERSSGLIDLWKFEMWNNMCGRRMN